MKFLPMLLITTLRSGGVGVSAPTINSVTVTGTRRVGEVLTAVVDATGADSLSYQWYRYGAAISGATNETYTLTSGDADQAVRVGVIAHNAGGNSAEAFSAWDAYTIPKTFDWTAASNTTYGVAGTDGTASVGLIGWTPMKSNNFRVQGGVAEATQTGGGFAYRSDIAFRTGRLRLNDRFAFQGANQGGSYRYCGGVGFNPTTGMGYIVQWNMAASGSILALRLQSGGTYPATTSPGAATHVLSSTSYTGGASTDWCVVERTVLNETSYLTVKVCPDSSGHPDYSNPRLTWSGVDTFAPTASPGYAFIAAYSSVANPTNYTRFEVTSKPFDIVAGSVRVATSTTTDITLTGISTLWDASTTFIASSGLTINSTTINSTTSATLNVTTGAALADVTITASDGSQTRVYVRTSAAADTRQVYGALRNASTSKIAASNTYPATTFVGSIAGAYGVGFSADGTYIYALNSTNVLKYNTSAVLQATITYTGLSGVRKMLTLPSSDYLLCNYGPSTIQRLNSSDVDQGQWAAPSGGAYGMCLLYDQALARNTVLVAGWGSQKIWQYELDGTLIKEWASALGGAISDVASDSKGSVYALDWTNGHLLKFGNTGGSAAAIATTTSAPHGITVLSDDTILVSCELGTYANRVRGFTPAGAELGDWLISSVANVDVKIAPV